MSMNENHLRNSICKIGRKLYTNKYVVATDGNISAKLNDHYMLITPAGICKGKLTEIDIVKIDINSESVFESELSPSSEYRLHLFSYRKNKDIECIIHAHPIFSTICAVSGLAMDKPILPEVIISVGKVPLIKYENPGSVELAENISEKLKKFRAVLMANHGIVVTGKELVETFYTLERLEFAFTVLYFSKLLGKTHIIEPEKVEKLIEGIDIPPLLKNLAKR